MTSSLYLGALHPIPSVDVNSVENDEIVGLPEVNPIKDETVKLENVPTFPVKEDTLNVEKDPLVPVKEETAKVENDEIVAPPSDVKPIRDETAKVENVPDFPKKVSVYKVDIEPDKP